MLERASQEIDILVGNSLVGIHPSIPPLIHFPLFKGLQEQSFKSSFLTIFIRIKSPLYQDLQHSRWSGLFSLPTTLLPLLTKLQPSGLLHGSGSSLMPADCPRAFALADPSVLNAIPSPLRAPFICLPLLQWYYQKYSVNLLTCVITDSARIEASWEQRLVQLLVWCTQTLTYCGPYMNVC